MRALLPYLAALACLAYLYFAFQVVDAPRAGGAGATPYPTQGPGRPGPEARAQLDAVRKKNLRGQEGPVTPLNDGGFDGWQRVVEELAALPPADLLEALEGRDPFGVRRFGEALVERESQLGRLLRLDELRGLFPCPQERERVSLPDLRDAARRDAFRRGDAGTWLFFQHLRKAGGTNFCTLAKRNLPRERVSRYYCMPDFDWTGGWRERQAGFLQHWPNEEIERRMAAEGWRVAGNEWDRFERRFFDLPGTVFATSFRSPVHRALSQFRFECAEERGCHVKTMEEWWPRRKDLYNVYTTTFSDARGPLAKWYLDEVPGAAEHRRRLAVSALEVLQRFNLVLVMEWLSYAGEAVAENLGFRDLSALTERVRPHISQRRRDDGQGTIAGAAGVGKASWDPRERLSPEMYKSVSESLALDELLTDAARRFFLERLVCAAP